MRRRILIAVLALGTVGGFASGFCSMGYHRHERQAAFERHVSELCAEAAARK